MPANVLKDKKAINHNIFSVFSNLLLEKISFKLRTVYIIVQMKPAMIISIPIGWCNILENAPIKISKKLKINRNGIKFLLVMIFGFMLS